MISQKCPKCRSNRVRRGYKKTSIFMKIICRYHLLCDNCNWEFSGFALPGTVSSKPKRSNQKKEDYIKTTPTDTQQAAKGKRRKKKVRIKFN